MVKWSLDLSNSLLGSSSGSSNSSWISESWVSEFSIVVFIVEGSNSLFTHGDEVVDEDLVRDVSIEVILEVLNLVHLSLNALVSSNSWERE